jgi:UDP-N-acetylglucosamine/UDP-N-acetylgalactosamine diphosphorylase
MLTIPPDVNQAIFQPLFRFWNRLSPSEKSNLLHQIRQIDLHLLASQQQLLKKSDSISNLFEPFTEVGIAGHKQNQLVGQKLIQDGRVGCLVLAGGQGSRLRFDGPKGTYPISIIKHKSLFQLCAEKVAAASRQAGKPLPLAVMTSPLNNQTTQDFFKQSQFFGLNSSQLFFFSQGMLPLLDSKGQLFLESPSQIAEGPNGNGSCLKHFVESGIWEAWHHQGIDYVNVILIDNALALPFDADLVGYHFQQKAEITIKCVEKESAEEKVGVLVNQHSHCRVIEYSELTQEERQATDPQGHLKYRYANLSLFCFSMSFIKNLFNQHLSLPLHKAWKASSFVDEKGEVCLSEKPNAWKFEYFIFDGLAYTDHVSALLYPREQCFAPLKNVDGPDSPFTVQQALQKRDQQIIEALTGLPAPSNPFELAADFYYPTQEMIPYWRGRIVRSGYIHSF